ncbi:MAG: cupredoxin domain-containing protein [Thermomicrobiales bacterium]
MTRLRTPRAMLSLVTALTMAVALVLISGVAPARAQGTVSVSIIDNAFDPGSITVTAGTTVVWTNNGAVAHTVTGDGFDSGTVDSGGTYSLTFDTPGTYDYVCTIHSGMAGSVIVTAAGDGDGTDDGTDDGADDGAAPVQMPTTGAGTTTLGDSSSFLLALGAAASALLVFAMRQRRVA